MATRSDGDGGEDVDIVGENITVDSKGGQWEGAESKSIKIVRVAVRQVLDDLRFPGPRDSSRE
jgi:hypothetical protein